MERAGGRRRVVVTGIGCVTPLGPDAAASWGAALAGHSAVGPIQRFDPRDLAVRIAAEAPDPLLPGDLPPKQVRRLDRAVRFAVAATEEALRDAELAPGRLDGERCGVVIGSGIGGIETLLANHRALLEGGPRRVSPFLIPMAIANMASGYLSIRYGLRGPNLCPASACASGAHALGEALRVLERGEADVVLAGGTEAAIQPLVVAGFAAMRALSTRNAAPARASRPFDADRDGFVLGEGAGVLVLEAEEHARRRGARVRARLLGYAASADAADLASPAEDGSGARRAMQGALRDAGCGPEAVGYLNAHATGTPAGDRIEAAAIRAVFGAHADQLPVSSTKSMTGHLLGAAGAVEAVWCVLALETGWLPPTVNLDRPDPECALDHVAHKARLQAVRVAVSNSFGFGGTNASLVLGREEE